MLVTTFDTLAREARFRQPDKNNFVYPALLDAVQCHIGSFNQITSLLVHAAKDIGKKTITDAERGNRLNCRDLSIHTITTNRSVWIDDAQIAKPQISGRDSTSLDRRLWPSECRERLASYRGKLTVRLTYQLNDGPEQSQLIDLGLLPVMVRSNRCHLEKLTPAELASRKEETEELGGYFVINGIERLIRLLVVQKRNHPMAIIRPSFAKRGAKYTQYGIQIRCVRKDESAQSLTLHYLSDASIILRLSWRKNEYLVPAIMVLKALLDTTDEEIFNSVVRGDVKNTYLTDRVELMLKSYKVYQLFTQKETLAYLGEHFRVILNVNDNWTDEEVGNWFLYKTILVHLEQNVDKFRLLLFMIQKLFALVADDCIQDNPDASQHQEVLLGGFLYANIMKERLEEYMNSIQAQIRQDMQRTPSQVDFIHTKYLSKVLSKVNADIGNKMQYFLSTGNLVSPTGLDLQQATGFTIVAEKINYLRYISHFRTIHRGAFFAELKTTTVRKLLPEAWGFLCPVHTPDGAPCGLLNHLSHKCKVIVKPSNVKDLPALIIGLGVSPPSSNISHLLSSCVQLDGKIIGWCTENLAKHVANVLRYWKVSKTNGVPLDLEIGYVPRSNGGQYEGLFLFSSRSRMMRPVKYLATGQEDWVGPFEQVHLDIACREEDIHLDVSTHVEYTPTNILSIVANLTPFSDFNQSPRNMYQCQMGKQTMGTPGTAIRYRTDSKIYRLQTGQTPVVRPILHNTYGLDNYPNGTNAVVAVISYTGYDMEDAMIINKSAHERGFAYGTLYKSVVINLSDLRPKGSKIAAHFGFGMNTPTRILEKLDEDGLPFIGMRIEEGDPLVAYWDESTGKTQIKLYKEHEIAYVEEVRLIGNDAGDQDCQLVHIKLRTTRAPVIGDKFSSRHGQKGVCSQKYPAIDMPFSESGMQPDIIINPHAFPSRMTIGMFIESLAGKAGVLQGKAQDSTPFQFNEQHTAADHFGEQLVEAGYNFHGNEPMYSGVNGTEFHADIYIGVVYYQRLRHMVNDKFQVRSTGPVHNITKQPVKGRKRAGGIRFGEMERDSVIAHGTSFILHDRLINCSDYSQAWVCRSCKSLLSVLSAVNANGANILGTSERCRTCAIEATGFEKDGDIWEDGLGGKWKGGDNVSLLSIPHVFKYLAAELAAMSITMRLTLN